MEQALEGDTGAANTLLGYAIPSTSNETTVAGLDDLVGLAPETRIRRINERALAGDLLLEHARVLTDAARQEAEVELLAPMRRLLGEVSAGSITLPEAIDRLAQLHDASVIDQALSNHPLAVTEP